MKLSNKNLQSSTELGQERNPAPKYSQSKTLSPKLKKKDFRCVDENCIFCKIIDGEIPRVSFWENEKFIAILDASPNTKGMTLVIPKDHHDSYVVDMDDKTYCEFFATAKKVAKILEKALGVKRVAMVMEGMGVNHAHIKLYPLHGLEKKFVEMYAPERRFFDHYEGYLTTVLGPEADMEELNKLAQIIRREAN